MRATWAMAKDEDGDVLSGDYTGTIRGEPGIRLHANQYGWHVEVQGVIAIERILQPHDIDRASRRRGYATHALDLAMERADAWACRVIEQRDEP